MSNTTQALSRIEAILDDSSFVEIGAGVTARSTDFNIQEKNRTAGQRNREAYHHSRL